MNVLSEVESIGFSGKKKCDCWCLTGEDCHVRICR